MSEPYLAKVLQIVDGEVQTRPEFKDLYKLDTSVECYMNYVTNMRKINREPMLYETWLASRTGWPSE